MKGYNTLKVEVTKEEELERFTLFNQMVDLVSQQGPKLNVDEFVKMICENYKSTFPIETYILEEMLELSSKDYPKPYRNNYNIGIIVNKKTPLFKKMFFLIKIFLFNTTIFNYSFLL